MCHCSRFFFRLLDKLPVTCPNSDSCDELLQRGLLSDHLRYRCSGTLVACQFAGAGCDFRGPSKKMSSHQSECRFKKEGKTSHNMDAFKFKNLQLQKKMTIGISLTGKIFYKHLSHTLVKMQ